MILQVQETAPDLHHRHPSINIGALIVTYIIQGAPYFQYTTMCPKALFSLLSPLHYYLFVVLTAGSVLHSCYCWCCSSCCPPLPALTAAPPAQHHQQLHQVVERRGTDSCRCMRRTGSGNPHLQCRKFLLSLLTQAQLCDCWQHHGRRPRPYTVYIHLCTHIYVYIYIYLHTPLFSTLSSER